MDKHGPAMTNSPGVSLKFDQKNAEVVNPQDR